MQLDQEKIICPNCRNGFDAKSDFCPNCGQKNKPLDLHFKYFIYEFLDASFNLDSKVWRTFKLLLFYPGKLTKEFMAGKRASYMPPLRIYLIVSLVYFTVLSFVNADIVNFKDDNNNPITADSAIAILDSLDRATETKVPADSVVDDEIGSNKKKEAIITLGNVDQLGDLIAIEGDTAVGDEGNGVGHSIGEKLRKLGTKEGKEAFAATFRNYLSIGMFVLMPITALLFFFLFQKKTYYVQHLVFVLHLQSAMFILFTLFNLIEMGTSSGWIDLLLAFLFLSLLFAWVKKFYGIRWWKAILKSILFLMLFSVVFGLFLGVVGAISAWNI